MENNILIPESLYIKLLEYLDGRSDADGSSEGFTANEEMKLLTELEECNKIINPTPVQSQASLASHSCTETNY